MCRGHGSEAGHQLSTLLDEVQEQARACVEQRGHEAVAMSTLQHLQLPVAAQQAAQFRSDRAEVHVDMKMNGYTMNTSCSVTVLYGRGYVSENANNDRPRTWFSCVLVRHVVVIIYPKPLRDTCVVTERE